VLLMLEYTDRPGVMGTVGTLLGGVGINIEAAQISQTTDRADAVMLLRVDRPVDQSVLSSIGTAAQATIIRAIDFT
jgi:D-3-phosphoglycerate dehydrogenase